MPPSPDHIRVSHAGTLPRPDGLKELLMAEPGSARAQTSLAAAVAEVVRKQVDMGIDIVNDGEFSKVRGFSEYVRERLGGLAPAASRRRLSVMARDLRDFPGFVGAKFARHVDFSAASGAECIAPLTYMGTATAQVDIANLKAAMRGLAVEAYLPAIAPSTIEHWLTNKYYASAEEFVYAIAEAMAHEYKLIVDAGFLLQIDDPDLADGWQMYPDMTVADYRKYAPCGSRRSITRCATFRRRKSGCTSAGAATTVRTRTTFLSRILSIFFCAGGPPATRSSSPMLAMSMSGASGKT